MGDNKFKDGLGKAKEKLVSAGDFVGTMASAAGEQIAKSKAVEKVSMAAKVGAKVVAEEAKVGANSIAKGSKAVAEKVADGAKVAANKVADGAKQSAEKVKSVIEERNSHIINFGDHKVLSIKGTGFKLLLPDSYIEVKKEIHEIEKAFTMEENLDCAYITQAENTFAMTGFFFPTSPMDFDDLEGLIDGIHVSLADNQGLIEAKKGFTKRGYKYIYSIVKSVGRGEDYPFGVRYFLRMDLQHEKEVVEIYGNFEEIGTTGLRESMCMCLAKQAGICEMGNPNWNEDPYDPSYTKGIQKNLAEKEGLDGMFPGNPLSIAHEFLLAIINDELVEYPKENANDDDPKSVEEETDSDEEVNQEEIYKALFADECHRKRYCVEIPIESDEEKREGNTREKLDDKLRECIDQYNAKYTLMSDKGTELYVLRERSVDLLENVENLVNSIANHPKEFDKDMAEIKSDKESFTQTCEYAKAELEAAQKSAMSAGAGIAGGAAVASLAPSVAMWVATTFGTASTGTAISALSGAAATNAALAWLGGGAAAAGGGGMAAGNALLALAGPVGWGIAGATLLTSIVLFSSKKIKIDKQKKEEIESVLENIEKVNEVDQKIKVLLDKTASLRTQLSELYSQCMSVFGSDYSKLDESNQIRLGTFVNEAKALAASLKEGIEA